MNKTANATADTTSRAADSIDGHPSISVNGKPRTFDDSLAKILTDYGIDVAHARGVAVAVNDEVVRRSNWTSHVLSPNDRVEIVTARQGG